MPLDLAWRAARASVVAVTLLLTVSPAAAADRVILVSWDGIRRDTLRDLLEWQPAGATPVACPNAKHEPRMPELCNGYLTCLPALCNFQIIDSMAVEGKPLTRPQHAQMLTGYGPVETGEITNSGKRSVPPGMTVYERIAAARPEVKTVHIAGRKFIGRGIIRWARYDEALDLDMRRGGRDQYTGDNTTEQFIPAMDYVGSNPFFIFIHYKAADVVAHRAGEGSTQYREAIVQNDEQLGDIMAVLASRGFLDSTEILVTTDHGFEGIFHVNGSLPSIANTWLASRTAVFGAGPATVLDVTPTVLDLLGINMTQADPPYRGVSQLAQPAP